MKTNNTLLVTNFIEEIWNQQQLDKLSVYLSSDFKDNSLPPSLPANVEGLKLWIAGTNVSFEHHTFIEESVCEDQKVMLKIRMRLKHIGAWRGIEATGAEIFTVGYRLFKLSDGKISEHWGLLDGNSIENQLRETSHGCKIQH